MAVYMAAAEVDAKGSLSRNIKGAKYGIRANASGDDQILNFSPLETIVRDKALIALKNKDKKEIKVLEKKINVTTIFDQTLVSDSDWPTDGGTTLNSKYKMIPILVGIDGKPVIVMTSIKAFSNVDEDGNQREYAVMNFVNTNDQKLAQVILPLIIDDGKGETQFYTWQGLKYASTYFGMLAGNKIKFYDLYGRFLKCLHTAVNARGTEELSTKSFLAIAKACKSEIILGKKGSRFGGATTLILNESICSDSIELKKSEITLDPIMVENYVNKVFEANKNIKIDDTAERLAESYNFVNSIKGLCIIGRSQSNDIFLKPNRVLNYIINMEGYLVRKHEKQCVAFGDVCARFNFAQGIGGDSSRCSTSSANMATPINSGNTYLNTEIGPICVGGPTLSVAFSWTADLKEGPGHNYGENAWITESALRKIAHSKDQELGTTSSKIDGGHKLKAMLEVFNNMSVDVIFPPKQNGGVAKAILLHYMLHWQAKNPTTPIKMEMFGWGLKKWRKEMPEINVMKKVRIGKAVVDTMVLDMPMYLQFGQDATEHARESEYRQLASMGAAIFSAYGGEVLAEAMDDVDDIKWLGSLMGAGYNPITGQYQAFYNQEEAEALGMVMGELVSEPFFRADRNVYLFGDLGILNKFDNDYNFKNTLKAIIQEADQRQFQGEGFKNLLSTACDESGLTGNDKTYVMVGYALFGIFSAQEIPNELATKMNSIRWVEVQHNCFVPCSPAVAGHNMVAAEISMTIKMGVKAYGITNTILSEELLNRITVDRHMDSYTWEQRMQHLLLSTENAEFNDRDVYNLDNAISLFFKSRKSHQGILEKLSNFQKGGKGAYLKALTHNGNVDEVYLDKKSYEKAVAYYKAKGLDWKNMTYFAIKFPIVEKPGIQFKINNSQFAPDGCMKMHFAAYKNMSGADCDGDGLVGTWEPRRWHDIFNANLHVQPIDEIKAHGVDFNELIENPKVKPFLQEQTEELVKSSHALGAMLLAGLKEYTATTTFAGARILTIAQELGVIQIGNMEQIATLCKEIGDKIQAALDLKHLGYGMLKEGVTANDIAAAMRREEAIEDLNPTASFGYFSEKAKSQGLMAGYALNAEDQLDLVSPEKLFAEFYAENTKKGGK